MKKITEFNETAIKLINGNNFEELKKLIKCHSEIDFVESLYEAAFKINNENFIKLLLRNDIKNKNIISFFYDEDYLNLKNLKFILKCGYEISPDIFSEFIIDNRVDLIKEIFEYSIFDNSFILKLLLYYKHNRCLTTSDLQDLITLEKCKIDMNRVDSDGNTLLITACSFHNESVIKLLVEHGADVNKDVVDIYGYSKSPLTSVCHNGNESIVKYLIDHGADANKEVVSKYGVSYLPLINACIDGNEFIVKYLVEHGADVNKRNSRGNTPLSVASFYEHERILKYLIKEGADVNSEVIDIDNVKKTPLTIAYEIGNENIINCLIEHGAKTNQTYPSYNNFFYF